MLQATNTEMENQINYMVHVLCAKDVLYSNPVVAQGQ